MIMIGDPLRFVFSERDVILFKLWVRDVFLLLSRLNLDE